MHLHPYDTKRHDITRHNNRQFHVGTWCAPKLLDRLKCEYEVKTTKEQRVGARSLARNTLRGRGACWSSGMGLKRMTSITHSHRSAQNQTTNWLVHNLSTFGTRTSHGQTRIHKTHHGPNLGEATTFPLIVYFMPLHEADTQMAFYPGIPKWEFWNCQSWDFCNFGAS